MAADVEEITDHFQLSLVFIQDVHFQFRVGSFFHPRLDWKYLRCGATPPIRFAQDCFEL